MTKKPEHHGCGCDHNHGHDHAHEQAHDHNPLSLKQRWAISVLTVGILLMVLRSFIVGQMLVRVTSYSADDSYADAVRVCKKIIAIDHQNIQAWTALGYAYMDSHRTDEAIAAFEKVLQINPYDTGAASYMLGQAYFQKGDLHKAIENLERVHQAGPRAGAVLEADVLKYRHGTMGFRSLNSMETLLHTLADAYSREGHGSQADQVKKEYEAYRAKRSKILF